MPGGSRRNIAVVALLLGALAASWTIARGMALARHWVDGVAGAAPYASCALAVGIGVGCLAIGLPRRVGTHPVCARCNYRRIEADRLLANCPECGSEWRWYGRTAAGTRVSHRWLWLVGLVLVIAGFSPLLVPGVQRLWIGAMPTTQLLRELSWGPQMSSAQHWAEIRTRTLSTEEYDAFVNGLLDRRIRSGGLEPAAREWLFEQSQGGSLSQKQMQRHYTELVECVLSTPSRITINLDGEATTVPFVVDGVSRESGWMFPTAERAWIVKVGAWIESIDEPGESASEPSTWRSSRFQPAQDFFEQSERRAGVGAGPDEFLGPGSGMLPAPMKPGRYRVRVVCCVLVGDEAAIPPRVVWVAEDEPHVPENMRWHTRVEMVREIDVVADTSPE
jgi:hypothetical protein